MNQLDQMFRWTFKLFVFLICFQFGFILFAYGLLQKAKKDQESLQPKVAFACGDFDTASSYFSLGHSGENLTQCIHEECPDSMWVEKNPQSQEQDLHVISIKKPQENDPNDERINGHTVRVSTGRNLKPYTLVLATQRDMTVWNLENLQEDTHLNKVIVLSKGLSWVEGIPEGLDVEYFSPETICALPIGWSEIENPNNEFRRLKQALQKHTGLAITSFQGKAKGRIFAVPPQVSKRSGRSIASLGVPRNSGGGEMVASVNTTAIPLATQGLRWERANKRVRSKEFEYINNGKTFTIEVPAGTQAAFFDNTSEQIFAIQKYRFGIYNPMTKTFRKIPVPLALQDMHWPSSMALDRQRRRVLIYNEERGGEIYSYSLDSGQWGDVTRGVGYTLSGLTYEETGGNFYASRVSGKKITQILKLGPTGQIMASRDLETPFDFSRSLWKLRLVVDPGNLWLQVFHPANPTGDIYPLPTIKASL